MSSALSLLNSIYTLKQHVRRNQSEVEPVGMTVSCQWKQCRMVCEQSSLLGHLERHIEKETTCIYDDCDERFSRVQDLGAHEKSEHADDEPGPPPCAISRPPELKPLPVLPKLSPRIRPQHGSRRNRLSPKTVTLALALGS
ncbi:hypothetical protein BJV78DRAFT_497600 [Lactifluus subvellereus]|nr:hypothetical protein BJV78DRAFT_497600 [Lactifluus subvellereus]